MMDKTPGSGALEKMQTLNNQIVEFAKPEIPRKKKKMKILTEEKYIEELSKIIQRDFFPDLEKLKAQNEYLDAVDNKDIEKLREIYAKYSGKRPSRLRPSQSPATFETPASTASSTPRTKAPGSPINVHEAPNGDLEGATSVISNHTLDSFLSTYTSEDNYSFQEIIDLAEEKLRQKFAILYNAEQVSHEKISQTLALPGIEKQFLAIERPNEVDTWTYKNKNYIMYIPDGVSLTKNEQMEMAHKKREINYKNTRLSGNPFDENQNKETISEMAKTQAKNLSGKVDVDGNLMQINPAQPRIFDFVRTPSPIPGEICTPIMTWGEIEGTPFRLDGGDTPFRPSTGPSFRINETSRRENIALELAEKAAERMRGQKQKALDTARKNIGSPYIRSSIERLQSMSPAAKRLASAKFGLSAAFVTPSPRRSPMTRPNSATGFSKTTPSPLVRKKTPGVSSSGKSYDSSCLQESDLTNDLLKIPAKRPKAHDFF